MAPLAFAVCGALTAWQLIEAEGIESLSMAELQAACSARGLKATSRSKAFLREELTEWLELSLSHNLPTSLLILANAFKITSTIAPKDALREALYHLPSKYEDPIQCCSPQRLTVLAGLWMRFVSRWLKSAWRTVP